MRRSLVETVMGAVVLIVAAYFLVFAYQHSNLAPIDGYELVAKFNNADGLGAGSDVRIAGVKVGSVTAQSIDNESYLAVIAMTIDAEVSLPTDTVATITGDGLLGGKYLKLEPGGDEERIFAGGEITNTKDVIVLEELLGKAIFLLSEE